MIVHRLLDDGPSGFDEPEETVEGISSEVLSGGPDDLDEKPLEPVIVAMCDRGANAPSGPNTRRRRPAGNREFDRTVFA